MADIACGRLIIGRHAFRKIAISEWKLFTRRIINRFVYAVDLNKPLCLHHCRCLYWKPSLYNITQFLSLTLRHNPICDVMVSVIQQSANRHVALLEHIIKISSQPVCSFYLLLRA
jgi:hypothetical protein